MAKTFSDSIENNKMKIISAYKEYYDYLSGKYGVDPLITYARPKPDKHFTFGNIQADSQHNVGPYYNGIRYYMLALCDQMHLVVYELKTDQFFLDKEAIEKLLEYEEREARWFFAKRYNGHQESFPYPTQVNIKMGQPVVICHDRFQGFETGRSINPKLSDWGVNKLFDAETIYLMLIDWFSKPKELSIDSRTDKQKIVGNGFDLKESFRNVK